MKVKFSDVVKRINIFVDINNTDRKYYIGKGGSIESDAFEAYPKALIEGATIGYKFHFGFNPGHILFMSRSFEQHKAATATFYGVCSDSTYVVETRDEKVLLQRYLQVEMQSDRFWNWLMDHKTGGVNYLINYSTLAEYEFDLPSIEHQKDIADILWSAYDLKVSYGRMIDSIDEMVKSQFIEMFGDPNANTKNWKTCKVSELFSLQMGKTPSRDNSAYWSSPDHKWISIADLGKYEKFTNVTEESISDEAVQSTGIKIIPKGTVIMSFKLSVGKTAITSEDIYSNEAIVAFIPKDDTYKTEFLYDLVSYYDWLEHAIQAVKGKTLNKESLGVNNLIIPPVDFQKKWICISRQADKSKFELKQAIAKIDKVMRALMQ